MFNFDPTIKPDIPTPKPGIGGLASAGVTPDAKPGDVSDAGKIVLTALTAIGAVLMFKALKGH